MARFKVKLKATAIRDVKQDHPTYRIVDPEEWFKFFGEAGITKRRSLFESRNQDGEFAPAKMTKGICLQRQTPPTPQNLKGTSAKPVTIICDAKQLEQLEHDRLNIEILSQEKVADDAQLGLFEGEELPAAPEPSRHAKVDRSSGRSA
jgi:hypothetical protein